MKSTIVIISFCFIGLALLIISCAFAYQIITDTKDGHKERQAKMKGGTNVAK